MKTVSRRQFLSGLGTGVSSTALGLALAQRLGFAETLLALPEERLTFGALDPLVDLLQGTPADELLPLAVRELSGGRSVDELVAAAALANARALGGTNYDGYHTLMALPPSRLMARGMPAELAPLPVLKVLHRNARVIAAAGRATEDALATVEAPAAAEPAELAVAVRERDLPRAERVLAALERHGTSEQRARAYEELQGVVRDELDVHRIVLSWRAYDLLRFTGPEQATTLLRQSVRFCIDEDERRVADGRPANEIQTLLPELVREHGLDQRAPGGTRVDDARIEALAATVFGAPKADAAGAVARALAEGTDPEDVGAAISLAATSLLLHDPGRAQAQPGKPIGTVHGASVGVHASDAANAWRHVARVGGAANATASLIAAAFHTAGQTRMVQELPFDHDAEPCLLVEPAALLAELAGRVRDRDQRGACGAARRYAALGHDPEAFFAALLPFAVSEDGALHAEKYFLTVREEHAAARPAHRGLWLAGLARVMASQQGFPAPGVAEARELLLG